MQYTIRAHNGDTVKVEAINAFVAIGKASGFFQLDPDRKGEWRVECRADGSVYVEELVGMRNWTMERDAPAIQIVIKGHEGAPDEEEAAEEFNPDSTIDIPLGAPPPLVMPEASLKLEDPNIALNRLAELVFDLSVDIAGETPETAAKMALDVIAGVIESEGVNVIRGLPGDERLVVLSGKGSLGEPLIGAEIEYGVGMVGAAYGQELVLHLHEFDAERLAHLPEAVRSQVKNVLCAPIRNDLGDGYGVIQLLNCQGDVQHAQLDALAAIGRTLAINFGAEMAF